MYTCVCVVVCVCVCVCVCLSVCVLITYAQYFLFFYIIKSLLVLKLLECQFSCS